MVGQRLPTNAIVVYFDLRQCIIYVFQSDSSQTSSKHGSLLDFPTGHVWAGHCRRESIITTAKYLCAGRSTRGNRGRRQGKVQMIQHMYVSMRGSSQGEGAGSARRERPNDIACHWDEVLRREQTPAAKNVINRYVVAHLCMRSAVPTFCCSKPAQHLHRQT